VVSPPVETPIRPLLALRRFAARWRQHGSLYEALPVKRFFRPSTFFDSESSYAHCERVSAFHGNGSPFCLAALSGQPPLARKGRAFSARG
jgi:hypothetical protein